VALFLFLFMAILMIISDVIEKISTGVVNPLSAIFLSPGSTFSVWSLLTAAVISLLFCLVRLRRKQLRPNSRWLRHLFLPNWWFSNPSMRADIGMFFLNSFVTGALIGWGLLSYTALSQGFEVFFSKALGSEAIIKLPISFSIIIYSFALFIAYDFAYWLDHTIKHKIPIFWEFHRVHHSAEKLSPLTVFRMHPVDSLIFYNITAFIMALMNGLCLAILGGTVTLLSIGGVNLFVLIFVFTTIHLQHSHIHIRFEGIWGKIFFSPAHHHLHHSNNPAHYGCNMGGCLAVWDLMFGTLRMPTNEHKNLDYGVPSDGVDEHSVKGCLIAPFERALLQLMRPLRNTNLMGFFIIKIKTPNLRL
jgi:sterol desaturase/sphingolipid hydroxylase (fatty acid hydroxylase superfamily)